jgi:glycosyltransferase involved in cell wall biosynthesis
MRIAVIHNLGLGGAHRRLSEQMARLDSEALEVCLGTAVPVTRDAHVISLRPLAPALPRGLRAPLRYVDFAALLGAWGRVALAVRRLGVQAVYANPCRYLQAPAALLGSLPPTLYFCDEARRVDNDPSARASRNRATRPVYGPMYGAERRLDRRAVARATRIATNSGFSAEQIAGAYRRRAEVIPLGASDVFRTVEARAPAHILSVGTLIPSKGHDVVIAAVAQARRRLPVLVIAPSPEPAETARLQRMAREAGVELEVRTGVPDHELAEAYAGAQATVYMAVREPLGLASLEAQAAGSPVVVAAEGGLPETLAAGISGWVVERSPAAVAAKLDQLETPGLRERMSAAGREHAAQATWERSARAVERMLAELVS